MSSSSTVVNPSQSSSSAPTRVSAAQQVDTDVENQHRFGSRRDGPVILDEVADAVDSPSQERERLEDAESLYSINVPPTAAEAAAGEKPGPKEDPQTYNLSEFTDVEKQQKHQFGSRTEGLGNLDEVADAIDSPSQDRQRLEDAGSLFSVNVPPTAAEATAGEEPRPKEELDPKPKNYNPFGFEVLSSLIPGSIFGVLLRLGLLAITTYDGQEIFSLAWVQAAGCFVMGFSLGFRDQIGAFYAPLYTAIATGFCGSVTTFSSWQFDIFIAWANTGHAHRDWFRDVIDGLSQTVFTMAISLSAVNLGLHLARLLVRYVPRVRRAPVRLRYAFRIVSVLMYAATIPAYFKASPKFRHEATAALLFSYPGTLTRYLLATTLTPRVKLLPLGTFVANTVGTALIGMFHILQRTPSLPSPNACAILQGLMDGYCGCLTTVSTFAVEIGALKTRKAWLYFMLSWVVSQCLLLIILGSSWWAGNIDDSRVCTYA